MDWGAAFRRFRAIVIASVMLAGVLFAGCGNSGGLLTASTTPASDVSLTLAPTLRGRALAVAGTTSLPDGVFIVYEISPLDPNIVEVARGYATVRGGSFTDPVDLTAWPSGDVVVWVAFQTELDATHSQPQVVLDRFGQHGERLTGANVTRAGELRRVEATARLSLAP